MAPQRSGPGPGRRARHQPVHGRAPRGLRSPSERGRLQGAAFDRASTRSFGCTALLFWLVVVLGRVPGTSPQVLFALLKVLGGCLNLKPIETVT